MRLRRDLLAIISDGEFHSGEALGRALGMSRMAVWKHIRALRDHGVALEVVRSRGYRLPASLELLDAGAIWDGLEPGTRERLAGVDTFLEIDSTNTWLRQRALEGAPSGSVCVAEMQSAGRGRHNRRWISPFAASLSLSLLWRSGIGAAELGGLSLATGVAVLHGLRAFGIVTAGLKWPNDVLVDGAKLAGILIDVVGESTGPCAVVVGIGINVAMPETAEVEIDQDWIDLRTMTGHERFSRNRLATVVLDRVVAAIVEFEHSGLQPVLEEWRRHDVIQDRQVSLQLPNEVIRGRACGIDSGGALLVDTATGRRRFASGEVSLRVAP
jgi:BirA family transcriptional regulator, biotin operon repressor / biotin---[acetyl-CoA-carboxylase] ligase